VCGLSPVKKDRLYLKNKGFGHKFLVLLRGDWRKESQFSPTAQDFLVPVKGDWRKESQFSPTTQEFGSG